MIYGEGLSGTERARDTTKAQIAGLTEIYARAGSCLSSLGEKALYHAVLSGDCDGVIEEVRIAWMPDGTQEKPNLKGSVSVMGSDAPGLVCNYSVYAIPDGWDVEKHERIIPSPDTPTELPAVPGLSNIELRMAEWEAAEIRRLESEQWGRELNIVGLTETEGQGLIHRLMNY